MLLLISPAKDLEKLKGNDIRFLSIDKEVSGEEIEQIKKIFPNAEINFPIENLEKEDERQQETSLPIPINNIYNGELKTKRELKILSGAYLLYPTLFQGIMYNFDTLRFEERYANQNYTNVFQRLPTGQSMGGEFYFGRTFWRSIKKDRIKQKLFWIPDSPYMSSIYPELRAFSGMYWIYQGELSRRKFKKNFLKKSWGDIRIEFDKNNSMFTIHLKSPTGFEKITAYPFTYNNIPLEKVQQTYVIKFLGYEKALSRRAELFRRNLNKGKKKYDANFKKMHDYAWKELQINMCNEEKLMSQNDWLEYYDNIVANEKKAIDNAPLSLAFLLRQLSLVGFNTRAGNNRTPTTGFRINTLNVDFIDATGSGKLAVANIIILDNRNKTFSQMTGTLGLAPNLIPISQYSSNLVFVQLRNGDFGLVTSNEIDRQPIQPLQTCQYKVKVFDKNLDTIGNLLKAAGLE